MMNMTTTSSCVCNRKMSSLSSISKHSNINFNMAKSNIKSKLLFITLLLCYNQNVSSLKLTPIPSHQSNKIDLTTEARLVNAALAEATSTIKSSHSFIDVNEAEAILQQKQFQRLSSAIDRWNAIGDKFHQALANNEKSFSHQSLMLEEVSRSVAASKALLGHFLHRSRREIQALPLLESSCPQLWGTIYDIETDILLDCYTALGSLYLKSDRQTSLENLQNDLIKYMPWLKYALIDSAIEKSHASNLDSVELIKLVLDLSFMEREIISTETRRAWISIDEIRLSMNTLVAEFSVADSKAKKLSVLNKSKQIVDDLLERHKVASLKEIKYISDTLKNLTLQPKDIPHGLNEGNAKVHILKLSSSIINYLKTEIEKEATYYLDIMEGVIEKGKLYFSSQSFNEDTKSMENSHGFQSKADVYQIMEYIITKHENFDGHNSFAPFSSRKTSKIEQTVSKSYTKYSQASTTSRTDKTKNKTTKKQPTSTYSILITAVLGIAIVVVSNLFYSSRDDKQNGSRLSKAKQRVPKADIHKTYLKVLSFCTQIAYRCVQFVLSCILSKDKSTLTPSDIDDELIKELTEKPRKISGKKDNKSSKDKGSKKKRNSIDPLHHSNEVKNSTADNAAESLPEMTADMDLNVSSSSSDILSLSLSNSTKTFVNTKPNSLSISTSFPSTDEVFESIISDSAINTESDWIVTGQGKKKSPRSPIHKKELNSLRKEKSKVADAKSNNTQKNSPTADVKSKNKVNTNKVKAPLLPAQVRPLKDYRSITTSGLALEKKRTEYLSSSSSSSSSSPNHATQPSVSSTDNEDRSTDDSDQSIENDMITHTGPMQQSFFPGHPYFMPEMAVPPGMGEPMMYRMDMSQFPQIHNPPMMTFQGPEDQMYFMPNPMHMHPYMAPSDSAGFINPMSVFGNPFSSVTPPLVEARDDIILRIRSQIEYYFSEENLRKDQYLKSTMDGEGYVSLAKIKTFRRIQQLGADASMMLEAVKSSSKLHVIESIDGKNNDAPENTLLQTKICSLSWKTDQKNN